MKITIYDALSSLRPNKQFNWSGENVEDIIWLDGKTKSPTQSEIDLEIVRLTNEYQSQIEAKAAQRQAIADRLGLTADELQILLG